MLGNVRRDANVPHIWGAFASSPVRLLGWGKDGEPPIGDVLRASPLAALIAFCGAASKMGSHWRAPKSAGAFSSPIDAPIILCRPLREGRESDALAPHIANDFGCGSRLLATHPKIIHAFPQNPFPSAAQFSRLPLHLSSILQREKPSPPPCRQEKGSVEGSEGPGGVGEATHRGAEGEADDHVVGGAGRGETPLHHGDG